MSTMPNRAARIWVIAATLLCTGLQSIASGQLLTFSSPLHKLDPMLQPRALLVTGRSRVIVRGSRTDGILTLIRQVGGIAGVSLPIVSGWAAEVPNSTLLLLAGSSLVQHISADRVAV